MALKVYKPYPKSKLVDPTKYGYGEVWGTIDGQYIRIKDLRESHIENILTMIPPTHRYVKILKEELKRREMNKLIKKHKAAKVLFGK